MPVCLNYRRATGEGGDDLDVIVYLEDSYSLGSWGQEGLEAKLARAKSLNNLYVYI